MAPVFAAMAAQMRAMARGPAVGGPSPVLHALILLALACVIDRLQALVLAWHQGRLTLPPHQAAPVRTPPGRAWAALSHRARYQPPTPTPPASSPVEPAPPEHREPALRPGTERSALRAPMVRIADRGGAMSHPVPIKAFLCRLDAPRFQNPVSAAAPSCVLNVTYT